MSTYIVVVGLMFAALVLTSVSLVSENTITNQMAREQYRFVRMLRIMRRMTFLASVAIAAFTAYVIQALPGSLGVAVLFLSVLIGMMGQPHAVFYSDWPNVIRMGLNPWVAIGMSAGLWLQDSTMGIPAFIMAVLVWAQTHRINHYKTEQDLLYIRD